MPVCVRLPEFVILRFVFASLALRDARDLVFSREAIDVVRLTTKGDAVSISTKDRGARSSSLAATRLKMGAAAFVLCGALVAVGPVAGCSSGGAEPSASSSSSAAQVEPDDSTGRYARVGDITSFETTTLAGDAFTQDDFAPYDLTMVNIWSTTCGFCIDEMPALESLSRSLPDNVGLVSICVDASVNTDAARRIVETQGVTYPVLVDNARLGALLLSKISGTPTTVFVDSTGALVGDVQQGVPARGGADAVESAYRKLIDEHLAELA